MDACDAYRYFGLGVATVSLPFLYVGLKGIFDDCLVIAYRDRLNAEPPESITRMDMCRHIMNRRTES